MANEKARSKSGLAWSLNGVSEQEASPNAHCHMASQCQDLSTIPGLGLRGPRPRCQMTLGGKEFILPKQDSCSHAQNHAVSSLVMHSVL